MPLAERLSSKFHSCSRSFAYRPTALSVAGIILKYTATGRGLFLTYPYNRQNAMTPNFSGRIVKAF